MVKGRSRLDRADQPPSRVTQRHCLNLLFAGTSNASSSAVTTLVAQFNLSTVHLCYIHRALLTSRIELIDCVTAHRCMHEVLALGEADAGPQCRPLQPLAYRRCPVTRARTSHWSAPAAQQANSVQGCRVCPHRHGRCHQRGHQLHRSGTALLPGATAVSNKSKGSQHSGGRWRRQRRRQ